MCPKMGKTLLRKVNPWRKPKRLLCAISNTNGVSNSSLSRSGEIFDLKKMSRQCLDMEPIWTAAGECASLASTKLSVDVSPAWQMLLLSNGSVTRHVELLTGGEVSIECLEMGVVEEEVADGLNLVQEALQIPQPLIQRQVFLYSDSVEEPCMYAISWWNAKKADEFLTDVKKPIWVNLSESRTELYREIKTVYCGHSDELERHMRVEGPLWGRHYVLWHGGEPLTVIYEAFSNRLEGFLLGNTYK